MNSFGFAGARPASVFRNGPVQRGGRPHGLLARWSRAASAFLGLAAICLFAAFPARAFEPGSQEGGLFGGPLLKIIYAAETQGEVRPCFY